MRKSVLSMFSLGLLLSTASSASADPANGAVEKEQNKKGYIVVLKSGVAHAGVSGQDVADVVADVSSRHGGSVIRTFTHALQGAAIQLTPGGAAALAKDDRVAYVEEDAIVQDTRLLAKASLSSVAPVGLTGSAVTTAALSAASTNVSQTTESWGLDRIDQRQLPIDGTFNYPSQGGEGVHIYSIDYGANMAHEEFIKEDGTSRLVPEWDFVDNDSTPDDCIGWGAIASGIAAGKQYGVAKKATVHVLRVYDCNMFGAYSNIIAAIDWVTAHHVHPAVAFVHNQQTKSQAMNDAVAASIAHGVTYVAMAGNGNSDACQISPASLPEVITVGGSRNTDQRLEISNWGSCVDIFAPGLAIGGAWVGWPGAYNWVSGTDLSASLVVGTAALYLGQHPSASPAEVTNALLSQATTGVLTNLAGSPDRLLYEGFLTTPSGARPCDGLCSNPVPISWTGSYQGGNLGTSALCYETTQDIWGGNCGNFVSARTLKVNGVAERCDWGNWASIPAKRNGGYCIQVTAGNYPWAYMTLW